MITNLHVSPPVTGADPLSLGMSLGDGARRGTSTESFDQEFTAAFTAALEKLGVNPQGFRLSSSGSGDTRQFLVTFAPPNSVAQPKTARGNTIVAPPQENVVPAETQSSMQGSFHGFQHCYVPDPADDAYWGQQPPAVQQLREIPDMKQREMLADTLAGQGYKIDVPVMVWGWDAAKTTALRQDYGYTWVPSANMAPIQTAPGLFEPGLQPYDPLHPPPGAILVPAKAA